jgi:SAM-dependent methyltransferase
MDAAAWDERYRAAEMVWGVAPNRWVEQETGGLQPGIALDLACGEGRNAIWFASRGWRVHAVDFSAVALAKGATLEERTLGEPRIHWVEADATTYVPTEPVDLALLCYLQLPAQQRRAAVRQAAAALAPGGTLLVIGHDSRNLSDGTGGPKDPDVPAASSQSALIAATQLAGSRPSPGLFISANRTIPVLSTRNVPRFANPVVSLKTP